MLALARRAALSGRGKAAANTPATTASLARQANPRLSGRELAQVVRERRSSAGAAGTRRSTPTGRQRPSRPAASGNVPGAAEDQPWKVGVTETARGQRVTGTRVGRSQSVTGDEPSTCRPVTGTEYMGADIFREFCQAEAPRLTPDKVRATSTAAGNRVTGNELGRSTRVTGDEPGTCKNVTGTEYLSAEQVGAWCGTTPEPNPRRTGQARTVGGRPVSGIMVGRSQKVTGDEAGAGVHLTGTQYTSASEVPSRVPSKVGVGTTLSGRSSVTGVQVGRSASVTGDEPGSCRAVTGDEYIGREQFEAFCDTRPAPEPPKVGVSTTLKQQRVSGTQTGRSARVTGDEPGTCKAITGTPYAGLEQASEYCAPEQRRAIQARVRPLASTPGPRATGSAPSIGRGRGAPMTGAEIGACEPVTGTPYIGIDQFAEACPGAAQLTDADFPQRLDGAPWEAFSVASPARQALVQRRQGGVTGTHYEGGGPVTGPFGMGAGKITGTEQFRFDGRQSAPPANLLDMEEPGDEVGESAAPERPRVTGEGQSAGAKITGDDWDRGDRVTGTEGHSARRRNPTRPGSPSPMSARAPVPAKRNADVPKPTSRVTGSSGNTDRGSLITYSGGARG